MAATDRILDKAERAMRAVFPKLPWTIRISYKGKIRFFGHGPERVELAFKTEAALACLARSDIPTFLDYYVVGDVDFIGDIYAIVGVRLHVASDKEWMVDLARRAKFVWTSIFPSSIRRKLIAVSSHYDLPQEFILSYLDKRTKAYSCAIWNDPANIALPDDEALEDAQHRKFDQAATALQIQPDDKFLDVGCGYGYMVHHAETAFGCRDARGITLSKGQIEKGFSRNMHLKHYLELPRDASYDKIYTCGMVSHLDKSEIRRYYTHLYGLLKSGGRMWMHGIVPPANDHSLTNYTTISGTFSQKYVFPDHYQFPIHVHLQMMEELGFKVRDVKFRYGHYAKTLRHWYRRYLENLPQTRHMITPVIERAWHLFLTFASVTDGDVSVVKQILAEKP